MKNSYILGGGLSGLIYHFYNKDYTIISKDIGGKLLDEGFDNTFYLHDNKFSRKLLDDLNINFKKETHTIKYLLDNNKIVNEITVGEKLNIIQKKMGKDFVAKDINLSTDDCYIPYLKFNTNLLLDKLTKDANLIKDEVIRITDKEIVCKKSRYEYDSLISSIPADIFWKLYNKPKKLDHIQVTFFLTDRLPLKIKNMPCDLLYTSDKDIPFNRINKKNGKYLFEITGRCKVEDFLKDFDTKTKISNTWIDKRGIIISNENNIPPKNVKFIGRFGTWIHNYKTSDVVRDANIKYDFESIFQEQKDFNSNFFDYNIKDEKEKQKVLKEFIINLGEEIGEFSRLVLKKNHRDFVEPDRELVLEEYIDILKYVLGLTNIYGFSIDEIFRKFWEKSEIVRNKYEKFKIK